jgi:imidazole glycerol-phosphate synthase subunit HisF
MTVLGRAGSNEHIEQLLLQLGIVGAAAGSLFVYKGKFRAVLINYPTADQKLKIYDYIK